MNCKPGDLAIVIGDSEYSGKLVEVLYAAPRHEFNLPDGYRHLAEEPGVWVIQILGSKVRAPIVRYGNRAGWRLAQYGTAKDSKLRPLRGEPETERHDEEIAA